MSPVQDDPLDVLAAQHGALMGAFRGTEVESGDAGAKAREAAARTIRRAPRDQPLPLSFAQQRLWFLDQLEGPSPTYNIPGALEFSGALDIEALTFALSEIVRRHESLRTCLVAQAGDPVQVIAPAHPLTLPTIDLRQASNPAGEAVRLARQEALTPFDLAREAPLRAQLLRHAESTWTLLLTLHHSAADGWSIGILIRELVALYGAFRDGRSSPLPELAVQYADFALWQRAWLSGERLKQELDHWRARLADVPDCLNLPTDRPRPPRQSYRGATLAFSVEAELVTGIQELSRHAGATLFMTLFGAWSCVLGRYSGEQDIVIGSPVANRTQSAIEPLIGFFVNTLVLRAELGGNPSFVELLERLRHTCLEAYAHQELPFEALVEALGVTRNLAHAPLFQVMFVLNNTAQENLVLPDVDIRLAASESSVAKFDLTLSITEVEGTFDAALEYATDLFERETIERLCGHFVELLRSVLAHPEASINELNILPAAERQQLVIDWNATAAPLSAACVHELFEAQAARTPEAPAVVYGDEVLSYAELNARANQLAHMLIALGVGADALVTIALERSPQMIVALLATLKAGGAYVPLDPEYPAERLDFMLGDCGARILLTQEALKPQMPQSAEHTLCLDSAWTRLAQHPDRNPEPPVTPHHLAYVIYTSGSTGTPKGVAMPHEPLCNLIGWQLQNTPQLRTDTLQYTTLSFDVSFQEIFTTLVAGGCLFLIQNDLRRDSADLLGFLDAHRTQRLFMPYVALAALSEAANDSGGIPRALQAVFTAGEQLRITPAIAHLFQRSGARLHNQYGPTETHVVTAFDLCSEVSQWPELPPIGRPIANTQVYVLDQHAQPTPIGVPGELHIGGAGLARGYVNRPALTAEKFIPDPFSGEPGARLYRTGDLVRCRPDGNLEFLGRLDHQVKIRGFRIEPGEIEAALAAHPDVREAVVIARTDDGDQRLVAYIVTIEAAPAASELRTFLQKTLPDYMLPAAFVLLPALPLTPSGKLDRKALPAPKPAASSHAVAPRSALEVKLVGLWSTVLHQDTVGIHDNFFELGGHSLLATRLTSQVRDALGIAVPVRWLFEAPTIAEFAGRLHSARQSGEAAVQSQTNRILAGISRITPDLLPLVSLSQTEIDLVVSSVEGGISNVQDIYPLSPLQEGILFHHRLQDSRDPYLNFMLLAFNSRARGEAFVAALQAIVDRHDTLRTAMVWEKLPEPVQVVWRHAPLPVRLLDFDPAKNPIVEQLVEECHPRHTRIDLSRAPLLRIALAQDGERTWLLLTYHHLIVDHTTLDLMAEEIATILHGEADRLPTPVPFRNFVAAARGGLTPAAHEAFFRDMLGAIDHPTAPFGLLDVQGDGAAIIEAHRDLTPELALRLRTQARRLRATPAAVCHLAWALMLSRCCGQDEVVFGTVLFGRLQGGEGVERALGLFMNTLPLRITCDARPVAAALSETQQSLMELVRHEHAPLSLAQRCSALPALTPLFSALFNYRHSPVDAASPPVEGIELVRVKDRTNYPFVLSVDDLGEGFGLTAQVDPTVDPGRICAFMQNALDGLVTALEEAPQTPLCTLDILPAAERQQLLVDWNTTSAPVLAACLHELFEAQVARTPEATAVVFGDEVVSYAELNAHANQLAHALIAGGVGPDVLVAIALERSPQLIVALLATLKAGGTYVPVDPAYPAGRVAFMLEDSGARLLLTQETLRPQLPPTTVATLCLDTEAPALAMSPAHNPQRVVTADDLAYVIYTSGSAGTPKGVQVSHSALAAFLGSMRRAPGVGPSDRLLAVTTFSFDIAGLELGLPLTTGSTVILASSDEARDGRQLSALISRQRATVMQATPATWRLLLEAGWHNDGQLRILVGGEALPADLARLLVGLASEVWNLYGPTETTIWSTVHRVTHVGTSVSIGRPIANTRLYVLDRYHHPAPIGVPGELHIGGVGLARGYLHRPALTAERFIPDPFSGEPGARLYTTGDLVRYRADGELEFLGRRDQQVKLRGFRIELSEIEVALAEQPSLAQAAVLARDDGPSGKQLVAYLVPEPAASPNIDDIRRTLAERLPDYMVPAAFVILEALPLTPSGKLDRRALPAPARRIESPVLPRTPAEESLCGVFAEILDLEFVGIDDSFFDQGGDSLLALRLFDRIRAKMGCMIALAEIFRYRTVRTMARRLQDGPADKSWSPLVPISIKGDGIPIYCIHPSGGNVICYADLAAQLGPDRPIFGVQALGLIPEQEPIESIDEMSDVYVREILADSSLDRCHVLGFSFGGILAFDVGRKLRAAGVAVGFVGSFDGYPPEVFDDTAVERAPNDTELLLRFTVIRDEMSITEQELRELPEEEQFAYLVGEARRLRLISEETDFDTVRRILRVYERNATMPFQPCRYDGVLTLFHVDDSNNLKDAWDAYARRVEKHVIAGTHDTMIRPPHVAGLARLVTACLERAESEGAS